MSDIFLKICDNCGDFDREKSQCLIRNVVIVKDKKRFPLKRKFTDKACPVFIYRYE